MRIRFVLTALLLYAAPAFGQTQNTCNNVSNFSSATLTASAQLIAVPTNITGLSIHICSYVIQVSQSATPVTFGLTSGTGSVCATTNALVTPLYLGVASTGQLVSEVYSTGSPLNVPAGKNLCLALSGAPTGAVVHITWSAY